MKRHIQDPNEKIPAEWRSDRESMFLRFASELSAWSETGAEPRDADRGVRYMLDLQEKRLEKRGLKLRHKLEVHDLPVAQIGKGPVSWINPYEKCTHFCSCHDTKTILRGDRRVYRKKRETTLYEAITEPGGEGWAKSDTLYNCPNCGSVSTVAELVEGGCPYCKTHYLASELYPKVSGYYQLDSYDREGLIVKTKLFAVLFAAAGVAFGLFSGAESVFERIFTALIAGGLGALAGYIFFSFIILIWLIINAIRTAPLLGSYKGKSGSRRKMSKKLLSFDPSFTYEYIAARALSLYGIIAFSDDPRGLSQFCGERPEKYDGLVDSASRGTVRINFVGKEGKDLAVELELYLCNIYDSPGRLRAKNERVKMRMSHMADKPLNANFSIHAVRCPGCGAGFDASRLRRCPYCGTDFRPEWEDWIVTELE